MTGRHITEGAGPNEQSPKAMNILVTGGSKGIGRGICLRFAGVGATVFINYANDQEAAEQTASEVEHLGGTAHLVRGDVSTPEGAVDLLSAVAEQTDRLDLLVHGAVDPFSSPTLTMPAERFRRAVDLNGSALLFLVQAALPLFGRGSSVVFLSSRGSKAAVPHYAAVGAAKALAEALVRYLAVELGPRGVRINTVTASALLTDAFRAAVPKAEERFASLAAATPLARTLTVDDVAAAVEYLAGAGASMVTGTELVVDGGLYIRS